MSKAPVTHQVLSSFRTLLSRDMECIAEVGCRIPIPKFSSNTMSNLIEAAIPVFREQPTLLKLQPPIYVVGDLHGSLHDILRILKAISLRETNNQVLLLGDYIDRGEFSIEVMTILTALAVELPGRCFLLRGNHETREVSERYRFRAQIVETYGSDELWLAFTEMFQYMPLAALIGDDIFCVHGGITPELDTLSVIDQIRRPVNVDDSEPVQHLLWADPSSEYVEFSPSHRGKGITFGSSAVEDFFKRTGMRRIIRAHQCVEEGVEVSLGGACITVFSSSWYKLKLSNQAAILRVFSSTKMAPVKFPPLPKLARRNARFTAINPNLVRPSSLAIFSGLQKAMQSFRTDPIQRDAERPSKQTRASYRKETAKMLLRGKTRTPT